MIRTAIALALMAAPATAQDLMTMRYLCGDRGVEVPAAYVTTPEGSVAVVHVEGRQIALLAEPAASGVRYGWPSDGSNYVWWTKGDEATLYWKDGAAGTETPLLQDCRRQD